MKRTVIAAAALAFVITGCDKESAYTKYENENFQIEYPKTWEAETDIFEVLPFAAYGPNQMVSIRTRLLDSIPEEERNLEKFVESRIKDFEKNIIGFNLQKIDRLEDAMVIHFSSGSKESENSNYYEAAMKLAMKGNKFYGVTCEAATKEEKDTVDYIMNSFHMK